MGGGGGGAVRFRPDTKSGGGGGACVGVCCTLQAQYKRREGCVAEEGEVPYNLLNSARFTIDY